MDDSSESDEDDFLLTQQTFKTPKQAAARLIKQEQQMHSVLEEALMASERHHESLLRIQQIRRDNHHNDDDDDSDVERCALSARIEQLTTTTNAPKNPQQPSSSRNNSPEDAALDNGAFDDEAFPREKRRALQKAADSELSCRLGARRGMIRFDMRSRRNDGSMRFLLSQDEAVEDLRRVLSSEELTTHPLSEALLKAADFGVLPEWLASERLVEFGGVLDEALCDWLMAAACSAGLGDMTLLADAAAKTLLSLRANAVFTKMISVQDFLGRLQCWLDNINKEALKDEVEEEPKEASNNNIRGLVNFLSLWETAVSFSSDGFGAASQCIATLVRLGLDASFDVRALQRIIADVIDAVAQSCNDLELKSWIEEAAKAALDGLTGLGPAQEDCAEDADDEGAWLCLSAAARVVPFETTRGSCSRAVHRFKAEIALQAVFALVVNEADECNSIESYVGRLLQETGQRELAELASSSVSWLAITAAYAGLVDIETHKKDIVKDPPKILATVECLLMACEAGMLLLDNDTTTTTGAEFGSIANAKTFVSFLEVFDDVCVRLSSRTMTNLATNPHFRRADMALMLFHSHNFVMKNRANFLAGAGKGGVKQSKVSSFFAPTANTASPIGG